MAHVSPQLIGFQPLDILRLGRGQRLALHLFKHPVHHGIMAHAHQSLRGSQPHSLQVVRQCGLPLRGFHPAMIALSESLPAGTAQPALPSMSAAAVFHHFIAHARWAFHPGIIAALHTKSIPAEQSPKDGNTNTGQDTAWLDAVQFLPDAAQTFSQWAATWNLPIGQNGKTDDPNGDGVPNFLAFAFGVPPMNNATATLPSVSNAGNTLTCTYKRSKQASGITWTPQVSLDFNTWTAVGVTNTKTSETSTVETWTATVNTTGQAKQFLRILVQ